MPAEIGQLTSLRELFLAGNQLTSLPAEIGQLTSLKRLYLEGNRLTSVPAEIWQLTGCEVELDSAARRDRGLYVIAAPLRVGVLCDRRL